jgi:hypothetical protein
MGNELEALAVRDVARLAEILAGMKGSKDDRWYWREMAMRRITALEEDGAMLGLVPHEERELATLKSALTPRDPLPEPAQEPRP